MLISKGSAVPLVSPRRVLRCWATVKLLQLEAAGKGHLEMEIQTPYQQFSAAALWESWLTVCCCPGCGAADHLGHPASTPQVLLGVAVLV